MVRRHRGITPRDAQRARLRTKGLAAVGRRVGGLSILSFGAKPNGNCGNCVNSTVAPISAICTIPAVAVLAWKGSLMSRPTRPAARDQETDQPHRAAYILHARSVHHGRGANGQGPEPDGSGRNDGNYPADRAQLAEEIPRVFLTVFKVGKQSAPLGSKLTCCQQPIAPWCKPAGWRLTTRPPRNGAGRCGLQKTTRSVSISRASTAASCAR